MIELRNFIDRQGRVPYLRWFDDLDREASRRIARAVSRLTDGNTSNVKRLEKASMNLKSTSGPDTAFTSAGRETRSSSSSAAARRKDSRTTFVKRKHVGRISNLDFDRDGKRLTVPHKDGLIARMKREPKFAAAMLHEGVNALLDCEFNVGKDMLRDYVNATIGFDRLSKKTKIPVKSLMRMLGPAGNPQMSNLFAIIVALKRHAGIELHLAAE